MINSRLLIKVYYNNRDLNPRMRVQRLLRQNEKMRFNPCVKEKDGLTEKSLRDLQGLQFFDEL
jgi:hypothetical protein